MRNDPVLGFPASGGTALVRMELAVFLIFQSTHPVRGGTLPCICPADALEFQSTHPVRGGTGFKSLQTTE